MIYLIEPNGELWDVAGLVGRHLGYCGGTAGLAAMATRNLGFVAISVCPKWAYVKLRPDFLSQKCFEKVLRILLRNNRPRTVIALDHPRYFPQIFDTIEEAALRLASVRDGVVHLKPSACFAAEALDIGFVHTPRRESLVRHYRYWQRRRGRIDRPLMKEMMQRPLGLGALYARMTRDGRVIPETWPTYMRIYKPSDAIRFIGKPFDEHDDGGYLAASSASYASTLESAAPRFEIVQAALNPPNGPPRQIRFDRLLLPWRSPSGEDFVSSIAFVRSRLVTLPACG